MDKKKSRLRRGRQTRAKIAELKVNRLAVHRTNLHIYAQVIGPDATVLASASTLEAEVRQQLARITVLLRLGVGKASLLRHQQAHRFPQLRLAVAPS